MYSWLTLSHLVHRSTGIVLCSSIVTQVVVVKVVLVIVVIEGLVVSLGRVGVAVVLVVVVV